jgi:hypothetical protein
MLLGPRLEERPPRVTFWARVALRCTVWGSVVLLCGAAFIAHCCLRQSPEAYQGLHGAKSWVPLETLSQESRAYVEVYYGHPHFALGRVKGTRFFEWPNPYNIFSGWLYQATLEEDDILQLVLNNGTNCLPVKRKLQLEDLLRITYADQYHLRALLRRGAISPKRYREVSAFLTKMESSEN